MDELIRNIAIYALPIIFAITLHEAAHAYAARYFGDDTAYAAGRMSINPLKHIDPFGTILLPLALYLSVGFVFGYAKPVPVDFARLNNPRRDSAWVALAGPGANIVMTLMWMALGYALVQFGVTGPIPHRMVLAGIFANLGMCAFNLLPLPPLDGSRVVMSALPNRLANRFARLEPYGIFILLLLLVLSHFGFPNIFSFLMKPVLALGLFLLHLIQSPLSLFVK